MIIISSMNQTSDVQQPQRFSECKT